MFSFPSFSQGDRDSLYSPGFSTSRVEGIPTVVHNSRLYNFSLLKMTFGASWSGVCGRLMPTYSEAEADGSLWVWGQLVCLVNSRSASAPQWAPLSLSEQNKTKQENDKPHLSKTKFVFWKSSSPSLGFLVVFVSACWLLNRLQGLCALSCCTGTEGALLG